MWIYASWWCCVPLHAPERSHPALCDLQPRVSHEKQTVWPPEEQRPRLRPLPHRPQFHKQKQEGQEEEQIMPFFLGNPRVGLNAVQCSAPSRRTLTGGDHFYKVDFNGLEVYITITLIICDGLHKREASDSRFSWSDWNFVYFSF